MPNPAVDATDHTDSGPLPGLEDLWAETRGDARITIAVLDGPVDLSHPCFRGAQLDQLATHLSGPADDGPATRHGTHVASVIFGQSDEPVRGIAPQCRGLIVPIFRDGPDGSLAPCSQVDLARAVSQAVEAGAQVINISGGEFSPSGTAHPILADAVRHAAKRGALIVAAAGNQGCDCLHVPGALPSVLAVGAMNAQGEPLEFSNWGEAYRTQGVLAAGENIRGAAPGGGAAMQTGTSYATPVVSGVIGLLLSLQLKSGQAANPQGVRASVLETALDCTHQEAPDCRRVLAGRLNVAGAAAQIQQGVSNMSERSELQETPTVGRTEGVVETSDGSQTQQAAVSPAAAERLTPAEESAEITNDQVPMTSGSGGGESVAPAAGLRAAVEEPTEAGEVRAATCGCGCGGNRPAQLVFALGTLGFDYGTEARRDSIAQHMKQPANPHDPEQLLAYLEDNPWDATEVIWTLSGHRVLLLAMPASSSAGF
jgi:cyanobactin maturation PatA/PatG family protease